jgi:hypothetical protein
MTESNGGNWPSDAAKAGWEAATDELELLAEERRMEGWELLTMTVSNAVPESPEPGKSDQFGLLYAVTEDEADRLTEFLDGAAIDEFEAYRRTVGATCFLLTELRDTENRLCVLVAGAYDVDEAKPLAAHAAEVGHLFTRFERHDGTLVAEFRQEAYEKLLPPSLVE